MNPSLRTGLIGLAVGSALGLSGGYGLYHRKAPVVADKPHEEVRLGPAAVIVKEIPVPGPLPRPKALPKDYTVVRHVEVDVQPDAPKKPVLDPSRGVHEDLDIAPEPVKVSMDLVRQPDGHLRVVASVEGGTIVGSVDIPDTSAPVTAQAPQPRELKWMAGVYRTQPFDRVQTPQWGVHLQRTAGPFVAFAGASRSEVHVGVGIRF